MIAAGDGKCVICDSYVRPCTLVRICDECNYGSYQGRCVICGGPGVSDAYYCKECTITEKDVSSIFDVIICIFLHGLCFHMLSFRPWPRVVWWFSKSAASNYACYRDLFMYVY